MIKKGLCKRFRKNKGKIYREAPHSSPSCAARPYKKKRKIYREAPHSSPSRAARPYKKKRIAVLGTDRIFFFEFSPGGINPHLNFYISESLRAGSLIAFCTQRDGTEVHNGAQEEATPADDAATHLRLPCRGGETGTPEHGVVAAP
jgi:hypothetical protein